MWLKCTACGYLAKCQLGMKGHISVNTGQPCGTLSVSYLNDDMTPYSGPVPSAGPPPRADAVKEAPTPDPAPPPIRWREFL
jgi:hypothetical protein